MGRYIKPEYKAKKFTCPYCEAIAGIEWISIYPCIDSWGTFTYTTSGSNSNNEYVLDEISISHCIVCGEIHVWKDKVMIFPENTGIVMPREDMPDCVKEIYEEARVVYPKSSKAAAALLRLALQKLCKELGYKGENINNDIAQMVKEGLSPTVQKVLDIIRVTGNEAVHPGTIDFTDDDNIAIKLFDMINFIVDKMITDPKVINALYDKLPDDKIAAIEKRDKK